MSPLLFFLLFLGFFTQSAVGFGSTLLIATLGALTLPMTVVLPVVSLLNLGVTSWTLYHDRHLVVWEELWKRLVPGMLVGTLLAFWLVPFGDHVELRRAYAVFVMGIALLELWRSLYPPPKTRMKPLEAASWILAGGFVQGAFATSGPLVVAYASRVLPDKGAFRATLAFLWLLMNVVLSVRYAVGGFVTVPVLLQAGLGLGPVALGVWLGNLAHHRLNGEIFRKGVATTLILAGLALVLQ